MDRTWGGGCPRPRRKLCAPHLPAVCVEAAGGPGPVWLQCPAEVWAPCWVWLACAASRCPARGQGSGSSLQVGSASPGFMAGAGWPLSCPVEGLVGSCSVMPLASTRSGHQSSSDSCGLMAEARGSWMSVGAGGRRGPSSEHPTGHSRGLRGQVSQEAARALPFWGRSLGPLGVSTCPQGGSSQRAWKPVPCAWVCTDTGAHTFRRALLSPASAEVKSVRHFPRRHAQLSPQEATAVIVWWVGQLRAYWGLHWEPHPSDLQPVPWGLPPGSPHPAAAQLGVLCPGALCPPAYCPQETSALLPHTAHSPPVSILKREGYRSTREGLRGAG